MDTTEFHWMTSQKILWQSTPTRDSSNIIAYLLGYLLPISLSANNGDISPGPAWCLHIPWWHFDHKEDWSKTFEQPIYSAPEAFGSRYESETWKMFLHVAGGRVPGTYDLRKGTTINYQQNMCNCGSSSTYKCVATEIICGNAKLLWKFLPNLLMHLAPLYMLLQKQSPWSWENKMMLSRRPSQCWHLHVYLIIMTLPSHSSWHVMAWYMA